MKPTRKHSPEIVNHQHRNPFASHWGEGTTSSSDGTEKIETVSPARLVFHVFAALAEFERNLIRERTMAGLTAARARGRTGGRPPKLTPKEIKTIRALLKSAEIPVAEIAALFHIARSTLYRSVVNHGAN